MHPIYIVLLVFLAIYLVSIGVFIYVALTNRNKQRRIKKTTTILITSINDSLNYIENIFKNSEIEFSYEGIIFPVNLDKYIDNKRIQIIMNYETTLGKVKLLTQKCNSKSREEVTTFITAIEDSLINYRRLVLKHNKLVTDYNFYARSIIFIPAILIFSIHKRKYI